MSKAQTQPIEENVDAKDQLANEVFGKKDVTPEMLLKRETALKNMRYASITRVKSKDLIGQEFDILDAVRCTINGDDSVQFILKLKSGEIVSASKSANMYSHLFADYFETFPSDEAEPMTGYTFAEEGEAKNGNRPVVIRKL